MNDVLNFWNSRAGLKEKACTKDLIAKQLEIREIKSYVRDGMRILDFGCGNGITAIEIAKEFDVDIIGMDYSPEMVKEAQTYLADFPQLKGRVTFLVGDISTLVGKGSFDLVYTERVIINLPDWQKQKEAIKILISVLSSDGIYVMCENSQEGVDVLNTYRSKLGLPMIQPPWHNRYLIPSTELAELLDEYKLSQENYYSSLYYYLSRIVNAYQAQVKGEEPVYDSPVNQLALLLPNHNINWQFAQGFIWVWKKN